MKHSEDDDETGLMPYRVANPSKSGVVVRTKLQSCDRTRKSCIKTNHKHIV